MTKMKDGKVILQHRRPLCVVKKMKEEQLRVGRVLSAREAVDIKETNNIMLA